MCAAHFISNEDIFQRVVTMVSLHTTDYSDIIIVYNGNDIKILCFVFGKTFYNSLD